MAAITPVTGISRMTVLRTGATGTTTDWIDVPLWVNSITVHLNITVAGTNTIVTIKQGNPVLRDDAQAITMVTGATITAIGYHTYTIVPNATAVADAVATNTAVVAAAPIPSLIGITTTPTGSTYSTAIEFKKV